MAHQQPAASGAERGIQLQQGGMDEGDPSIRPARQGIQDIGIENEGAINGGAIGEGCGQCGVIDVAKVPAEPDQ
jgi:hypothetical protein